jgi:hypothetical protein
LNSQTPNNKHSKQQTLQTTIITNNKYQTRVAEHQTTNNKHSKQQTTNITNNKQSN